jgi:hypothetical protein
MAKKNKSHTATADASVMYMSVIAGVIAMASVMAPWYYKDMDPTMGTAWRVTRSYSPMGPTDMTEGTVSWGSLSESMCMKMEQYMSKGSGLAGLGAAVAGQAIGALANKASGGATGDNVGQDSVRLLGGCGMWPICREHVQVRCALYRTLKIGAMAAAGLLGIGALCGFLTVAFLQMEASAKKKQAVLDARMKTMVASIVSCACMVIGTAVFYSQMENMFKVFNESAYYPVPNKYVGFGMAGLAIAQSCCACCCAAYRKSNAFPEKQADEAPIMADGGAGGYGGYPPAGQYGGYQQY